MPILTKVPLRTAGALGVSLAYGAGFWLVLLHRAEGGHERGEPALLLHGLRDGTLALPAVMAAAWLGAALALRLADGEGRLPAAWRSGLTAAGGAVAAAFVLAAGSPLHRYLFEVSEGAGLPAGLHYGRDALIALAAGLPVALAAVALADRLAPARRAGAEAETPRPEAPEHRQVPSVTRRGFVAGAGGLAAVGLVGAGLTRSSARAQVTAPTDRLQLFINDGHVAMVDGALVYMRGFGEAPSSDPRPSFTIPPTVFLKGGQGPITSRHYPLEAEIPEEGCPADAGVDGRGLGLHHIHRRRWASFFPRRVIVAESGSTVKLRITNRLSRPHSFTIAGVVHETLGPAGSATASKDVDFAAPAPGTYLYQDTAEAPVNRILGLYGALVVVPAERPWTLDAGGEGEFERQWVWIFHDIDPEWSRRARMGATIDPQATPSVPRYFTLNDRSGVFAIAHSPDAAENRRAHEDTTPCGHGRKVDVRNFSRPDAGTGQLIRLVNAGIATHQPHFHGNHVWTMAIDNQTLSRSVPTMRNGDLRLQHWEDTVDVEPLVTKAVMLPIKPPSDALDVVVANQKCDWVYPMHCHAEMSQTAGGGLYPGGQVSDWILKP